MMAHELPELPRPFVPGDEYSPRDFYVADQMRAYATAHAASLEAEVARLRAALEEIADMTYDKWTNGARAGDIAIQALSHPGARDG